MNRLHKKCLIASALMHLLLLALLLISPAFLSSKRDTDSLPVLTFIPTKLTDDPFFGGGSPKATTPPAPTKQSPPPAMPTPQPPRVQLSQPSEPEPTRSEPKPQKKTEPERKPSKPKRVKNSQEPSTRPEPAEAPSTEVSSTEPAATDKRAKKKHEIKPTFNRSSESSKAAAERARVRAEAEAQAARAEYLAGLKRLQETVSKSGAFGTSIEMPGPGGEFYANYGQIVKSIYQHAWLPPDDLADDSATVTAKVVILKDGRVKLAMIIEPSRIPALNRSVERALKLQFIRPFPEGAKDSERTFLIDFNLNAKKSLG